MQFFNDDIIRGRDFTKEFSFQTSRSGGKGGQNVNKVSTKVELRFDINKSELLTGQEKKLMFLKQSSRINKNGILSIVSQSERTQLGNKQKVIGKFYKILEKSLKPVKKRIKKKVSEYEKQKRLDAKKRLSEKKERRRITNLNNY